MQILPPAPTSQGPAADQRPEPSRPQERHHAADGHLARPTGPARPSSRSGKLHAWPDFVDSFSFILCILLFFFLKELRKKEENLTKPPRLRKRSPLN